VVSYFLRYFSRLPPNKFLRIPPDLSPVSIRLVLLFLLLTRGATGPGPNLELVKSTPDVEQYTDARCPPDRTERKYGPDGKWISTKEDPIRINCYRSILKQIMQDGVNKYLTDYVVGQNDNGNAPAVPAAPVEPSAGVAKPEPATVQTKKSFWTHNRSRMYMTEDGTRRQIYYEEPRAGLKEVGVKQGALLFDGVVDGTTLSGTAYVFVKDCDPLSFSMKGTLTRDGKRITLSGKAPRVGTKCSIAGDKHEELIFDLVR
jgi:hypothetical protein